MSGRAALDPYAFTLANSPGVQGGMSMIMPAYGFSQGSVQFFSGVNSGNKTDMVLGGLNMTFSVYGVKSSGSYTSSINANIKSIPNTEMINKGMVLTPYEIAIQSGTKEALAIKSQVEAGAKLYKIGTLGKSEDISAQFWSIENPMIDPNAYARKFGMPVENIINADFIEIGTIKPNTNFITRPAPLAPNNPLGWGGGIEVVVPPNSIKIESFSIFNR